MKQSHFGRGSKEKQKGKKILHDIFQDRSKHTLSLRKKEWKIELSLESIWKRIIRHRVISTGILVGVLILVFGLSSLTKASVAVFYPQVCLGGWEGVSNAQGAPQVTDGNQKAFDETNSAVLRNSVSQMYCGGFSGDVPKEGDPKSLKVKFSWTAKSKFDLENAKVIITDPQEDFTSSTSTQTGATSTAATTTESVPEPKQEDTDSSTSTAPIVEPEPKKEEPKTEQELTPAADPAPVVPPAPEPVSTPASAPEAPASTPAPEPAAWLKWLIPAAYAQDPAATSSEPVKSPLFEVVYTTDGVAWNTIGTIAASELANASFEIPLSALSNWEDLSKIQIGLRSPEVRDDEVDVYLDSMWLEVEYGDLNLKELEKQDPAEEKPEKIKLESGKLFKTQKRHFKANENVQLEIQLTNLPKATTSATTTPLDLTATTSDRVPEPIVQEATSTPATTTSTTTSFFKSILKNIIPEVLAQTTEAKIVGAKVYDSEWTLVNVAPLVAETPTGVRIEIPKMGRDFKPGKYSIEVQVSNGEQVFTDSYEFTWGVLAVNLDKSIYRPGEEAYIQMAALTDTGNTICDADLVLDVTSPSQKITTFSVENGTIQKSQRCGNNNVIDTSDYFVHAGLYEKGIYHLKVTNRTNGYSVEDLFEVREDITFDVVRSGATRINPFKSSYEMKIDIVSRDAWSGMIMEKIPKSFTLEKSDEYIIEQDGDTQVLIWKKDFEAGEKETLKYIYNAPQISPEFFLLGPLSFSNEPNWISSMFGAKDKIFFEETRQWQIASDAACSALATGFWDDGTKWSGCTGTGGAPAATDTVTIGSGKVMTVRQDQTVGGITISAASVANGVSISSGKLTVNGNVSIAAVTAAVTSTFGVGSGEAEINGTVSITGSSISNGNSIFSISTGAATTTGGFTFAGGVTHAMVTFTGAGTLAIGGHLPTGGTVTTFAGSTIRMNGTGVQDIGAYTVRNLIIDKPSGAVVQKGQVTVSASSAFRILQGRYEMNIYGMGGNSTATFYMAAGTSYVVGTSTATNAIAFPSSFTKANITMDSGSTVVYAANAAQTISGTPAYANLTITSGATSVAKTAGAALTVNGDFTSTGPAQISFATYSHTFKGNIILNSTHATPVAATTYTLTMATPNTPAATSISGSAAATVSFNKVVLSNTSGVSITRNLSFSAGTSPSLTVSANVTLTPDPGVVLTSTGAITGSGVAKVTRITATADFSTQYAFTTKTLTNLTVDYAGTAAQTVSTLTYSTLHISNTAATVTLAGNTSGISTLLWIKQSATLSNSTFTLGITGNFKVDGTLSGSGLTTMSGASKTLDGTGQVTNSSGLTMSGNTSILSTANLTFTGTITVSGASTVVTNSGTVTANAATSVTGSAAGSTWTNSTDATLNVSGTLMSTGTLTATASGNTVAYVSTTAGQTIKNTTYYNLRIAKGAQTVTSGANLVVNGTMSFESGVYSATGFSTTVVDLILGSSGNTVNLGSNAITANNSLTFNGGTVTSSSYIIIAMTTSNSAPVFFGATTSITGSATLYFRALTNPSLIITVPGGDYGSWAVRPWASSNSNTFNQGGSITTTSSFNFEADAGVTGSVYNTNDNAITAAYIDFGFESRSGSWTVNYGASPVSLSNNGYPLNVVSNGGSHTLNLQDSTFNILQGGIGNWTSGTGALTINPGNSTFIMTSSLAGRQINTAGQALNDITFNGSGSWTLSSALVINGDFTILAGTVDSNSSSNFDISVGGNWSNAGTFYPRQGTVTFNGAGSQTIYGDNTWYGLSVVGSTARTVSFESSKTQTISANGSLTFQGAASNLLSLAPTTPSTAWKLAVSTTNVTQNITYTKPSYSDASGVTNFNQAVDGTGTGNVDEVGNINWTFGPKFYQSAFRVFENQDSADVGNPLASLNAAATLSSTGQAFRLRMLMHVSSSTLSQSGQSFELQYANRGAELTCAAVAGSAYEAVATSSPGSTWTQATSSANWGTRRSRPSLVYDNKMWISGGLKTGASTRSNDVWYSTNGKDWTEATSAAGWAGRTSHTMLNHNNLMWVMGGNAGTAGIKNDVWYSSDGSSWTQKTAAAGWTARDSHAAVVYDGKMWVMGGVNGSTYYNDVWYSTDGETWTQATSTANWSKREQLAAVVYDGKMWVLGGRNSAGTRLNDVWYSTDGNNWTQVTAAANWTGRSTHGAVVYDNKIYVIAGNTGTYDDDVWYSSDGSSWTQATAASGFAARNNPAPVVYNNRIWVLGGDAATYFNDVWYSGGGVFFKNNSSVADPSAITTNANDPTHSGHTVRYQDVDESAPFTNSRASIGVDEDGLWDFPLQVNSDFAAGTNICFRAVKQNGEVLTAYTQYPMVTTASEQTVTCSTPDPTVTFSGLDLTGVFTAPNTSTTTMSCSSATGCALSISSTGDTQNPGIYKSAATAHLIPSLTTTLSAGTEGYGVQGATTTAGTGGLLTISATYNKTGNAVGGLTIANSTLAVSSGVFTSKEVVVTYKAAAAVDTPLGSYSDTAIFSCFAN